MAEQTEQTTDQLRAELREVQAENQELRERLEKAIAQRDEEGMRHDALRTELEVLHPEVGIDPAYARRRRWEPESDIKLADDYRALVVLRKATAVKAQNAIDTEIQARVAELEAEEQAELEAREAAALALVDGDADS